ncbi:MAG: sugar transferase [Caldiserica bacterium]|nr:sugar transferase [Caldisericota bacterium]MDH7562171.1 sugar transferase [Caldisericota bacterium]
MNWSKNRLFFLILGDLILFNFSFLLAYVVRFGFDIPYLNFLPYLRYFPLFTLVYVLILGIFGVYEAEKDFGFFDNLLVLAPAVGVFVVVHLGLLFLLREFAFPRLTLVSAYLFLWFLTALFRALDSRLLRLTLAPPKALLLGTKKEVESFLREGKTDSVEVVGWIVGNSEEIPGIKAYPFSPCESLLGQSGAEEILILSSPEITPKILDLLIEARKKGVKLSMVPSLYELLTGNIPFTRWGNVPMVEIWREVPLTDRFLIRALDFFGALFLLICLSPVLLLSAIGIKITSPGPIFIHQERVGLGGKVFNLVKFRTMKPEAEKDTGPVFAQERDPRVTPFGRFLRLLRIDELPQFFNVLKGEMSLVGPRPERPVFVEKFEKEVPGYSLRFLVKPGMTGMAQIYGTYETSPANKLRYDLAYIRNQSFLLNLRLLFLTFKLMLGRKGAR